MNYMDLELAYEFVNSGGGMFDNRAYYSPYKDFLANTGLLEKWYTFEEARKKETLLKWCKENQIKIEGESNVEAEDW